MTKRVLIVEDKNEERRKAKEAVRARGFEAVAPLFGISDALREIEKGVDYVLTDLHFPVRSNTKGEPPAGLAVVIGAVFHRIPVAIVTDCGPEGHHSETVSWFFDGCIMNGFGAIFEEMPFLWVEKDPEGNSWVEALEELEEVYAKK